jgi:carboxypeptidase D
MASELKKEWDNNRDSLINYMYQVHIGVKGFVLNFESQPINKAVIQVEGIAYNVTTTNLGEYWRLLMPGNYQITGFHF